MSVTGLSAISARNSATMIGKLNAGPHHRVLLRRRLHRPRLPLGRGGARLRPARDLPGRRLGRAAGRDRARAAIRQRRGPDRLLRPWPQRDDPLPQQAADRGRFGRAISHSRWSGRRCSSGPALILTSIVLACGLAVTVLSNLPSLRLFGWLSAFAMMMALSPIFSSCGRQRLFYSGRRAVRHRRAVETKFLAAMHEYRDMSDARARTWGYRDGLAVAM